MNEREEIHRFWEIDAETYDASPAHHPTSPLERAAWAATLGRLLPPAPARVLDVGAGTGFLSLTAARLGHRVSALDFSAEMLSRLRSKAAAEDLEVEAIEGSADEPPEGPFDAIIERHLVWTLPDPASTLAAWRAAAPVGRLVLLETGWGSAANCRQALRARLRKTLRRARNLPPEHHDHYSPGLVASLPLGAGAPAESLVDLVESSPWGASRLKRMRDVEWAMTESRSGVERVLGVMPRFSISAGG